MLFFKTVEKINDFLMKLAGIGFLFMVGITCADIVLRLVWKPIIGAVELVMYVNAVCVAFALGATQIKKGHISVDILVSSFGKQKRKALSFINSILCIGFFSLVSWQISKYATTLLKTGELSETLKIPYYLYVYATSLGCFTLILVFVCDLVKVFYKEE